MFAETRRDASMLKGKVLGMCSVDVCVISRGVVLADKASHRQQQAQQERECCMRARGLSEMSRQASRS